MPKLWLFYLVLVSACGKSASLPNHYPNYYPTEFKTLKAALLAEAPTCQYSPDFVGPSKNTCWNMGTGSGDADMMLFAGLLCFSGEEIGCETVRRSVGANGKPWRSPGRVDKDPDNTFSRDMFLGLMAYLVKTHDTGLAQRFETWFNNNNHQLCLNACRMELTTWGLMGEVWKHIGLPRSTAMLKGQLHDDQLQNLSVAWLEHGYTEHLLAVTILIRQHIGSYTDLLEGAADRLVLKNPSNPMFRYLVEGNSRKVQEDTLKLCSIIPIEKVEWIFEELPEKGSKSMGWDYLFLIGLMISED